MKKAILLMMVCFMAAAASAQKWSDLTDEQKGKIKDLQDALGGWGSRDDGGDGLRRGLPLAVAPQAHAEDRAHSRIAGSC